MSTLTVLFAVSKPLSTQQAKNKFVTSANIEGLPIAMAPEEPSSSNESSASSDSDFKKGELRGVRLTETRLTCSTPAQF